MLHHAVDIYIFCCKSKTLNLPLVPSYIRFREGLQVRTLTAEGSPRVRIRIVEEYAHQIGTKKMLMECYYAQNISWVPRIVQTLQNNQLYSMENAQKRCCKMSECASKTNDNVGSVFVLFAATSAIWWLKL